MAKQLRSEPVYTKQCCNELVQQGAVVLVNHGNAFTSGNADRLVIAKQGIWLLEFKNPATVIRLNQKVMGEKINMRQKYCYLIVRAVDYTTTAGALYLPNAEYLAHFAPGQLLQALMMMKTRDCTGASPETSTTNVSS